MSTIRVYQNNNRVATATYLKNGSILQVYPEKRNFVTEAEFRNFWQRYVLNTLDFKQTERPSKRTKKVAYTPAPVQTTTEGWTFKEKHRFTAPAGTYYIGDLCYALPSNLYDKIFGGIGGYRSGLYSKGDDFFIMGGTAYGDGSYRGSDGKEFSVDAGIIGMAPIGLCKKNDGHGSSITGGHIYTFDQPVTGHFGGGVFNFCCNGWDRLVIDTNGCDEEDDGDCGDCDCCA